MIFYKESKPKKLSFFSGGGGGGEEGARVFDFFY